MRRGLVVATITATVALALAACGSGDAAEPTPTPSPSPTVTAEATPDDRSPDEKLRDAVRTSDTELAQTAIDEGADIEALADGNNALSIAITRDDLAMVEVLLAAGAQVEYPEFGFSQLWVAGNYAGSEVTQTLLDTGADPNGAGFEVPLTAAAYAGNVPALVTLLDAGADPNLEFVDGENSFTAIVSAGFGNNREAAEILLQWGADPSYEMPDGNTAADWLEYRGDIEFAEYLRSQGG